VKRTAVELPDAVEARPRHEAERRATTVSALLREAIGAHLDVAPQRVLGGSRTWNSGRSDTSTRIEELLRPELGT
jgi:hypothetical protein